MRLSMDVNDFLKDTYPFKERICALFDAWSEGNPQRRSCYPSDFQTVTAQAGSTMVNFTINFVHGGPPVSFMRRKLNDPLLVQAALGDAYTLVAPYEWTVTEETEHLAWEKLKTSLAVVKAVIISQFVFMLLGLWGLVVFWTITTRGDACRKRAHSEWREAIVPTAETLQVVVLSGFVQLILGLSMNLAFNNPNGNFGYVALFGIGIGCVGTFFTALLNSWIRGESASLFKAITYDQIDKVASGWADEDEEAGLIGRDYSTLYEAGASRGLGHLAALDWESMHLSMEKQMGLFDLSDNVFDEMKPEKDPNLLAAFLNSTLLSAFGGKKATGQVAEKEAAPAPELQVVPVEVPSGLPKSTLRDVMLQWRMRHTAHPREHDAVDWMLGQLDPEGFELVAVKVPEQARLLVVEALLQHTQKHADLQLDACRATRTQAVLQQLSQRFQGMQVDLPDDDEGTSKVRELIVSALKARIVGDAKSKRDITQEEGLMLQQTMHSLGPEFTLISMPCSKSNAEDEALELKNEVDMRADDVRAQSSEYMYDDEIFTEVTIVRREKPPDMIEDITAGRGPKRRRKIDVHGSHVKSSEPRRMSTIRTPSKKDIAALTAPLITPVPPPVDLLSSSAADHLAGGLASEAADMAALAAAPSAAAPVMDGSAAGAVAAAPAAAPSAAPAAEPQAASPPPSPPPLGEAQRSSTASLPGLHRDKTGLQRSKTGLIPQAESAASVRAASANPAKVSSGRKLLAWWRSKRKKSTADHDKMPCWKQYFILFLGSVAVGISTISVVTIAAVTPPLTQYFVLTTFGISMPLSLALHQLGRMGIVHARHRLALRRGRSVEGALTRKEIKKGAKLGSKAATTRNLQEPSVNVADIAAGLAEADAHAERERTFRRGQSAYLASALVDAAPSLISRDAERKSRAVMTRSSTAATNSFSTFLDEPSSAPTAASDAQRQATNPTPVFRPGKGGLERKSSSAFVRGAALLGKRGGDVAPPTQLPAVAERSTEAETMTQFL